MLGVVAIGVGTAVLGANETDAVKMVFERFAANLLSAPFMNHLMQETISTIPLNSSIR